MHRLESARVVDLTSIEDDNVIRLRFFASRIWLSELLLASWIRRFLSLKDRHVAQIVKKKQRIWTSHLKSRPLPSSIEAFVQNIDETSVKMELTTLHSLLAWNYWAFCGKCPREIGGPLCSGKNMSKSELSSLAWKWICGCRDSKQAWIPVHPSS